MDDRSWFPKLAEDGTSTSTIRFLPMSAAMLEDGYKKHWVTEFRHEFKGAKGGYYNEKCRTMLESKDEKCPVCEDNQANWDQHEADIRKARKLRKTNNYANILVIDDKGNPENNGKVKYFRFGNEILKIILEAAKADKDDEDSQPKIPFDLDDGHDFVFKTTKNSFNQVDYKQSKFKERARPVAVSEKEIEAIWSQCIDLREFVKSSDVKSYDDLKKRYDQVNGSESIAATPARPRMSQAVQEDETPMDEDFLRSLAGDE